MTEAPGHLGTPADYLSRAAGLGPNAVSSEVAAELRQVLWPELA
jgi:hypothetical protein